jgi:hypothetical protein
VFGNGGFHPLKFTMEEFSEVGELHIACF